jgi:acetyl/propionyl-CoA carboxylase alpha subunit
MADSDSTFKIKVNEFEFLFTKSETEAADLIKRSPGEFNLIKNHRSINATVIEADMTGKKLKIGLEGETFEVEIKDELDQQLEKMGFGAASAKHIKEIKAPMPGLVLEIAVTDGQEVNQGDKILILEAMKMENCIMIHANATIKKIMVSAGQAVEKGQVLVELE